MAIRQMGAISGNPRLKKRNQIVDLEARLAQFPATLAAQNQRKQQEQTAKYRKDQLALEKKSQQQSQKQHKQTLGFEREQARKTMGLEAAKLGGSVLSSDVGLGFGKKNPITMSQSADPGVSTAMQRQGTKMGSGGFFGDMNVGGGLQGALGGAGIGYGLANMFGGDKKWTKWLGAGMGALGGFTLGSGLMNGLFNVG